ncbi:MAG: DUF4416 family protein [Planctomycetota bacterium]|jgi:hypothetical protein
MVAGVPNAVKAEVAWGGGPASCIPLSEPDGAAESSAGGNTPFTLPFMAVLAADEAHRSAALDRIRALFGDSLLAGRPFPFTFTDYYEIQTGPDAVKQFLVFPPRPPALASWKRWAVGEERALAATSGSGLPRPANIDPGALTAQNLVLASTKNAAHRIPLEGEVFAEVELIYESGAYAPLPWTYPDYRTPEALALFAEARKLLKRLRREAGREP